MTRQYEENLCRLIACETVNDPALDKAESEKKFEKLEEVMREIYPNIFATCEQIAVEEATLLRWKSRDETKPAMVLMAHMDVVPAPGAWSVAPFEGVIKQGCIFGRGAMDTKGSLCAMYEAVENLIAKGFVPACDIYLASSHNEETMGKGAKYVRDYLVNNGIKLQLVLDEGGAVVEKPMPGLKGSYAMIGVTEKGYANVRFVSRGKGGHASAPPKNTPVEQLAKFVVSIEKHSPFRKAYPPVVKDMFKTLSTHMKQPYKMLFSHMGLFGALIKKVMPMVSAQAAAMLKTTCAFTMMEGSSAANVLPETASITANMRFISHQPMEESLKLIEKRAKKFGVEMEVLYAHDISPETRRDTDMYAYVKSICEETFPNAPVSPYLMTGGTDARHFATDCEATIRFSPTILNAQQLASMHAVDENLSVEALYKAVRFYEKLILGRLEDLHAPSYTKEMAPKIPECNEVELGE